MRASFGLCMAAGLMVGAAAAPGADEPIDANVVMVLKGAVDLGEAGKRDLDLEFQVRKGGWLKWCRGRTPRMGQGRHAGTIRDASIRNLTGRFTVEVQVKRDFWVDRGGLGTYTIELKASPDGKDVFGTYSGTFALMSQPKPAAPPRHRAPAIVEPANQPKGPLPPWLKGKKRAPAPAPAAPADQAPGKTGPAGKKPSGTKVSGEAVGTVIPAWPEAVAGHVPPQPGEHPRLIFRKADVAKLRKQAATPVGEAIMARFMKVIDYTAHNGSHKFDSWPGIGYGFAYQMTGDKKYAEKARQLMEAKFFVRQVLRGQDIHEAPQLQGLALTFDLCYDAWDEAFRTKCIDEIWQRSLECIYGTADGRTMGGLNLAYWSNHNGIRVAGAGLGALAVWQEKTSAGVVLGEQALAVADEAAYDAVGWLRDGCGGGAWFMEGLFYKGMTLVRGLAHFLHAYPVAMGQRIAAGMHSDSLIAGHFLEAAPGQVAVGTGRGGGLQGGSGIDSDSWAELIWTVGLGFVPADMLPGVKYLYTRSVGAKGDGSFGLQRACYAPYLLTCYPFDVAEKPPGESLRWISPDPVNGHWVFRPTWKDGQDIVMSWNMLTGVRGSCHYERVGPALHWELAGFGQKWFGGQFQPVVKGKEGVLAKDPVGAGLLGWRMEGRTAVIAFDLTPAYMPLLEVKRGDQTPRDVLARKAGGFRAVSVPAAPGLRVDMGISGVRHVAVDCSGASGAPLLVAVVDVIEVRDSADAKPRPAEIVWRLPLTGGGLSGEDNPFTVSKGGATLSGVVLGGSAAGRGGERECKDGKVLAVWTLQKGSAPAVAVEGQGPGAKVRIGKRTVRFDGKTIVLE